MDIFFTVKGNSVVIGDTVYPMHRWVPTPYGVLRFVADAKKTKEALQPLFFRLLNPKDVVAGLLGNLDVRAANKLATVVTIVLKDEVPRRGEDIVNLLIANYNQMSVDDKNKLAANTLEFVEKRLKTVQWELDSLEGHIQRYRAKKRGGEPERTGPAVPAERRGQRPQGGRPEHAAGGTGPGGTLREIKRQRCGHRASALGIEDPVLSELTQKLYNSKLEYQKLLETTGENNPMALTVAREIAAMPARHGKDPQPAQQPAGRPQQPRPPIPARLIPCCARYPQKERELAKISREQAIKNNLYSFLLEKREQSELAISSSVADTKIIHQAETSALPVSRKKLFIYMGALVVALGLGVGLVSAKELMNKNILFRSEIESMTAVPVIGEISYNATKETLAGANPKVSLMAEQFRQLRAAIGLYGKESGSKNCW